MTPRIAILVPVLAAAGIAVAGCGGGDPSASGPASSTPAGSQSASPRLGASVAPSNLPPAAASGSAGAPGGTGATGDDKRGANGGSANGGSANGGGVAPLPSPNGNSDPGSLPAGFPLPQGTLLGRIAVSKTDITAPMQVPDGERAVAFWKKELPAAGYKISLAGVVKEIGDITFTGNGCKRGSDLAISGEQVAFLCRR